MTSELRRECAEASKALYGHEATVSVRARFPGWRAAVSDRYGVAAAVVGLDENDALRRLLAYLKPKSTEAVTTDYAGQPRDANGTIHL